ncbi:hypothetical protein GN958_ATG03242 [Phytophthora infestans]|uniref:Uncharacterized protein n=1 Tax=Phytophthora infestans TaxID=4787 RepID=A0A8S9VAL1_PHYIN|nr:hypothetical protein GN958_ATG03242 [Phytophthora infestans]
MAHRTNAATEKDRPGADSIARCTCSSRQCSREELAPLTREDLDTNSASEERYDEQDAIIEIAQIEADEDGDNIAGDHDEAEDVDDATDKQCAAEEEDTVGGQDAQEEAADALDSEEEAVSDHEPEEGAVSDHETEEEVDDEVGGGRM